MVEQHEKRKNLLPAGTQTDFYTPRQYWWWRFVFGIYLAWHFADLIPFAVELFGRNGLVESFSSSPTFGVFPDLLHFIDCKTATLQAVLVTLVVLSCLLAVGWPYPRVNALLLFYGWASLLNRNVLISNPGIPYVGWLLLACALIRVEPKPGKPGVTQLAHDVMPWLYWGSWTLVALGYSLSGLHKMDSPSWIDGSALHHVLHNPLARDNALVVAMIAAPPLFLKLATWTSLALELLFFPLGLFWHTRHLFWFATLLFHIGILATVNFADLTLGVLMMHLFLFDARWLVGLRRAFVQA